MKKKSFLFILCLMTDVIPSFIILIYMFPLATKLIYKKSPFQYFWFIEIDKNKTKHTHTFKEIHQLISLTILAENGKCQWIFVIFLQKCRVVNIAKYMCLYTYMYTYSYRKWKSFDLFDVCLSVLSDPGYSGSMETCRVYIYRGKIFIEKKGRKNEKKVDLNWSFSYLLGCLHTV